MAYASSAFCTWRSMRRSWCTWREDVSLDLRHDKELDGADRIAHLLEELGDHLGALYASGLLYSERREQRGKHTSHHACMHLDHAYSLVRIAQVLKIEANNRNGVVSSLIGLDCILVAAIGLTKAREPTVSQTGAIWQLHTSRALAYWRWRRGVDTSSSSLPTLGQFLSCTWRGDMSVR